MRQSNVNGKGAVFQVSDAKWVAKVCLGVDDSGKPIIKQFSGKTEAIAKKKLRDFKKSTDYTEKHIPSTDILHTDDHRGITKKFIRSQDMEEAEGYKNDYGYPVRFWRAKNGVDWNRVHELFDCVFE